MVRNDSPLAFSNLLCCRSIVSSQNLYLYLVSCGVIEAETTRWHQQPSTRANSSATGSGQRPKAGEILHSYMLPSPLRGLNMLLMYIQCTCTCILCIYSYTVFQTPMMKVLKTPSLHLTPHSPPPLTLTVHRAMYSTIACSLFLTVAAVVLIVCLGRNAPCVKVERVTKESSLFAISGQTVVSVQYLWACL